MIPDFSSYMGTVTRTVTNVERDGAEMRTVTLERSYDTNIEDLWDAVTNPERLPRWFLPITGDLKLGGRYQFEGNAGGTINECAPPTRVTATWEFMGGVSWIEVDLAPEGESKARLRMSHTCPLDDHWRTYGPGAVGVGWDLGLLGLSAHIASETFSEEEFGTSEAGKGLIVAVSEDWGRAAVAAGEDSETASAAARLTTAFYTGEVAPEN